MSAIVFLLGAGASAQAGAPMMADFLDKAGDLFWSDEMPKAEKGHFKRVFDAIGKLQKVHSKAQLNLTNLESVFTTFELAGVIKKLPGTESAEIPQITASLKRLIVVTLQELIHFPLDSRRFEAPAPYSTFANLLGEIRGSRAENRSVSVVTFNYDLCIDVAMAFNGMGPDYVLDGSYAGPNRNPVQLMKLHGSINWASTETADEIKVIPVRDFLSKFSVPLARRNGFKKIDVGTRILKYFELLGQTDIKEEAVIVPPTWNKSDYHRNLSKVWEAAAKNLGEAQSIYVIGYSLPETDAFFKLLYALGTVGDSPLRRFVVFNPDPAVEDRFRSILGPGALERFHFEPATFEKAIEKIKENFP